MKTDTTKLFDELLKDNTKPDLTESQKIENEINEKIKASVESMQKSFDDKLKATEEKINNIINEKKEKKEDGNNQENTEESGDKQDIDISGEE